MAAISQQEIVKIAHLSKLSIGADEIIAITEDFNRILGFVEQIQQVDTSHIGSQAKTSTSQSAVRPDDARPSLSLDEVRKMAPHFEAGFFVVPKVIETE